MAARRVCAGCALELAAAWDYCPDCGSTLTRKCATCGARCYLDFEWCPTCGRRPKVGVLAEIRPLLYEWPPDAHVGCPYVETAHVHGLAS